MMTDVKDPGAPRRLTRTEAAKAYAALCERFGERPSRNTRGAIAVYRQGVGYWPAGPVLVQDFEDRYDWAVVWEGGPEDWSILSGYGADDSPAYPAGVFAEPINGWSLGLYPL